MPTDYYFNARFMSHKQTAMMRNAIFDSLKIKLPCTNIGLAFLGAAFMAVLSWQTAQTQLVRDAQASLQFTATSHRGALALVFDRLTSDLIGLASNPSVTSNAQDLIDDLDISLPGVTQAIAIYKSSATIEAKALMEANAPTSMYGRSRKAFDQAARQLLRTPGYRDILLLDQTGRIVYTANKGFEFTDKITSPVLQNTGLARIFRRLQTKGSAVQFEDFSSFPDDDKPTAFLGYSLSRRADTAMGTDHDSIRIGFLVLRLSPTLFDLVMSPRDELGLSGDVVLVGPDGRLRSQSSLASRLKPGTPIASTDCLKPEERSNGALWSFRSTGRLVQTTPFDAMGTPWTVVAIKSNAEALESIQFLKQGLMIGMAAVVLLTGLIGAVTTQRFVRPLVDLTQALTKLAAREPLAVIPGRERRDEIGQIARAVGAIEDLTAEDMRKLETLNEVNHRIAHTDALTNLANRRSFLSTLKTEFEACSKTATRSTVVLVDLDGFKPINDTYGHAAGDKVLIEIGLRLRGHVGDTAIVGRLGGDEFGIILPAVEDLRSIERIEIEMCQLIEEPIRLVTGIVDVSASLGFATFPRDHETAEIALDRADRAMYTSKAKRKERAATKGGDVHPNRSAA